MFGRKGIIIDQKDERMEQDGDNYPKEERKPAIDLIIISIICQHYFLNFLSDIRQSSEN